MSDACPSSRPQTVCRNVMLSAAGRRNYLVHWFREAFELLGLEGSVLVAESDLTRTVGRCGGRGLRRASFASPEYATSLLDLCAEQDVALLISLNDYELQRLAGGLAEQLARSSAWLTALTFKGGAPTVAAVIGAAA